MINIIIICCFKKLIILILELLIITSYLINKKNSIKQYKINKSFTFYNKQEKIEIGRRGK